MSITLKRAIIEGKQKCNENGFSPLTGMYGTARKVSNEISEKKSSYEIYRYWRFKMSELR